jgi:DNA polymerase-3 subunit beta
LSPFASDDHPIEDGEALVSAKHLMSLIKAVPTSLVELRREKHKLLIKAPGESYEASVVTMDPDLFPEFPSVPVGRTTIRRTVIQEMIERCSFATSGKNHHTAHHGTENAVLETTDDDLRMVATDGHRLALVTAAKENGESGLPMRLFMHWELLRPIGAVLMKTFTDPEIAVDDDGHVFYVHDNTTLIGLSDPDSKYPNYEQLFTKKKPPCRMSLDGTALANAVRRSVATGRRVTAVTLAGERDKLHVRVTAAEVGESSESIPAKYTGAGFEVAMNASFVLDFLKVSGDDVSMQLYPDPLKPVLFIGQEVGGCDYKYLIMPMRN